MSKIPGPRSRYPLIGNLDMIWFNNSTNDVNPFDTVWTALSVLYKKEGLYKFKLGPNQGVMIYDHKLARDLLKNNANLGKPLEYQLLRDWLGKGLLINKSGTLWKERRRLLTPAFHFQIIEDFLPIINEKANILLGRMDGCIARDWVDITELMFPCALDIISETSLGIEINSQQNKNQDYIKAVQNMSIYLFERLMRPWLWPDIIYYSTQSGGQLRQNLKVLHAMTRRVINEKKMNLLEAKGKEEKSLYSTQMQTYCENRDKNSIFANNKRKRLAFLDLLLDLHLKDNSLSLEDIREEVDTFMFAGHDTTAVCLAWTLYLLGLHPEIQCRVQEELDAIIDSQRDITSEDMKQMPYLEAVIKESLRHYPPVPIITRDITEDMQIGDYIIPKGVSLYLLISRLHMNSDVFEDPLAFRPERFCTEAVGKTMNSFCYTPFSAGARNCIGQKFALNELKIVLAKVLLKFNVLSLDRRDQIVVYNAIVSKPKHELRLKISPRNQVY